ncbi:MAG TPA: hypothetical protein PK517_06225 [Nitrosomonas sp.]|nr:hypothetical protein [Nitrosomonas sp.]
MKITWGKKAFCRLEITAHNKKTNSAGWVSEIIGHCPQGYWEIKKLLALHAVKPRRQIKQLLLSCT